MGVAVKAALGIGDTHFIEYVDGLQARFGALDAAMVKQWFN